MSPARKAGGGFGPRLARLLGVQSSPVQSRGASAPDTRGGAREWDFDDPLADARDRELEAQVRHGDGWWRYRRELAPLLTAFSILGTAFGLHPLVARTWPLVLVIGGGVTAAWVLWKASRRAERVYGVVAGGLATVLMAVGLALGVTHGWYLLALLVATLAAGVPWWSHQLPRDRIKAPWRQRRRFKRYIETWPQIAEARGLGGVRLQRVEVDEHGWSMWLRIPAVSRLTVANVVGAIEGLETAFGTPVGAVRVERERNRADRCMVRVNLIDPLGTAIPYPGPSGASVAEPVTLGIFEDRSLVRLPVVGQHWLIAGVTESGKSVLQRVLLAELLSRVDVVVWAVDVAKHGVQFGPFRTALHRLAHEEAAAVAMLEDALAIHGHRAAWMAAEGLTEWPLSAEHPQIVIVLDEVSDLLTIPDVAELLEALVKLGREQGITIVAATQRASADALGDTVVTRSQMSVRIALRCNERADGDLILGQGRTAEGWRPDRLPGMGAFLVLSSHHQTPRPARGYLLQADEARKLATRPDVGRGRLDAVSAGAPQATSDDQRPRHLEQRRAMVDVRSRRRGRPARLTADEPVLRLLRAAGPDGLTSDAIVRELLSNMSRATVFAALRRLADAGRVEQPEMGRWRVLSVPTATQDAAADG